MTTAQAYTHEFEVFWKSYPRRISKKAAFKSWQKAIKEGADIKKIMDAVMAYKAWLAPGNGWRPEPKHPTTWLNQGCWDDDYGEPEYEKPSITFKLPDEIVNKLRTVGLDDNQIKKWFDDAEFKQDAIIFTKEFVRDWVQRNFDGQMRRLFGFMPEFVLSVGRYLNAG